jgi:ATP-binding cassette subfamily B protein
MLMGAVNTQTTPLRFVISYVMRSPLLFIAAVSSSIINKAADILPEVLIGVAIDVVTGSGNAFLASHGVADAKEQLVVIAFFTIIIWMMESVFEFLYTILWGKITQQVQRAIRIDAYEHLQKLPLSYFNDMRVGKITSILNDDISEFEYILGAGMRDQGLNGLIQLVFSTILIGIIFYTVSPRICFIALLPVPFVAALSVYFKKKIYVAYRKVREATSSIASFVSHNIGGIMTIKGFGTEQHERNRMSRISRTYERVSMNAMHINAVFSPLVRIVVLAGFIYTLIKGGCLVFDGVIAVGSYSILIFLTQRLIWPFTGLADILDSYERSMSSVRRIMAIMSVPNDMSYESDGKGKHAEVVQEGEVTFDNVSFGYTESHLVLKKLSLTIPSKKTVAFVGQTGSGKSTIIRLLMRLYQPTKGSISIDGHEISELSLSALRHALGMVGQDSFLVPDTIANNIRYGAFNLPMEDVIKAAKAAQIHTFINALEKGYETEVDEGGRQLSGGQKQRLMLARALVRQPEVLILDEATSALDNETERALSRMLDSLKHSITIIMIAHRLMTVRHADTIFVLEKGSVAESGSHDELLKKDGLYARLWRSQIGEE